MTPTRPDTRPDRAGSQRVARGLEPDVPCDVQDRRDGDERDDPGVHPRTLPVQVAPLQAPCADEQTADDEDDGHDDPDRVIDARHRLAEVLEQAQLEDRIGQVQQGTRACRAGRSR